MRNPGKFAHGRCRDRAGHVCSNLDCRQPAVAGLYAVEDILGFLDRAILMHYMAKCADHWDRVFALPDVPAKVYPYRSVLHTVMDELQHLKLCVGLGSSGHYHRDGAAGHHLVKTVGAPLGLHHPGSQFGADPAAQRQVPGFPLFKLPAHRGYRHDRNPVFLAFVHQLAQV